MAGKLSGTIAGRPLIIEGNGQQLVLWVPDFWTAWTLWRVTPRQVAPIFRVSAATGIQTVLKIGQRQPIEISPRPRWWVRLLAPGLQSR